MTNLGAWNRWIGTSVAAALAASMAAAAAGGATSPGYTIPGNVPGFVKQAKDLGPVDPAQQIPVTVWLKLRNEQQLTELLSSQRQKGNAGYHRWITQDSFNSQFSPTAQDVKAVQAFLTAHKLSVLAVAENNFYVKVSGTVADVQKTFHVQIDSYSFHGATYRSNRANPSINDASGAHVAAISGLDDYGFEPANVHATEAAGGDGRIPVAKFSRTPPDGLFFEGQCFNQFGTESHAFTDGAGTTATYGPANRFGAPITNTALGALPPCGYAPQEMWTAYDMGAAFENGDDGTGETIVITDAYGSDQIQEEAATFSSFWGLPPIDLTVLRAPGAFHNTSPALGGGSPGWHDEIALDVEWSHAMAPGARIVLVVGPNNASDLDEAINYAVVHHLGNTISNSWGSVEGLGNPARFQRIDRILMSAAAQGIDVNFSSGDFADFEARLGFKSVSFPCSSAFATCVGGTSLFLNADRTINFQTGWGNNETRIGDISPTFGEVLDDNPPVDPPINFGLVFGGGGGSSLTFPKPSWQTGVPGTMRQVPDISLDGDPFTGVEIVSTDLSTGDLVVGVIGGTSLSVPMFSAIMADAATKNGNVGFGQVAPLLYGLGSGIIDVPGTFAASANNVTGSITDPAGTTNYSADDLAAPLDGVTNYVSAFYQSPFTSRYFVLTFGTDASLTTQTGWDNVTGLGTPDGVHFIDALVP